MRIELEFKGELSAWDVNPRAADWRREERLIEDASVALESSKQALKVVLPLRGKGSAKARTIIRDRVTEDLDRLFSVKQHLWLMLRTKRLGANLVSCETVCPSIDEVIAGCIEEERAKAA